MSSRTIRLVVLVGIAAVAALVAAVALLAFGGNDTAATKSEYGATVSNVRDRVDYAYAQVTRATSLDDLADRLDQASVAVGAAAQDLDDAPVAKGFETPNRQLVDRLHEFSDALANSAEQFRDPAFQEMTGDLNSFGLEEWDHVNAALAELQKKGLEVELLARH